ncbi:MAG TPA: SPOR domain-containing protein [Accumulibacter sp.]|uniref:SPOR domain-containing protein n=1 Tax=Accumulibacter sp. TaxID=2053492 RepID=UPI0025FA0383|nr:SPOR domain-containing protein [Accumulibacter sp.]MCM8598038.1 SPOR domain-containing protein [Accumulibacter sp.]MCM8663040.1 SPOR domain-containing protein [Accumulibacter sp.]HNC52708.1 SPOR domain-containing protein [Accumulibacter sp.]
MNRTAELMLPNDVQPETVPTEAPDAPTPQIPVIKPEMAQLLELTQAGGSTTTAKEINAQLDRVLRDYDELTALYAANNRRIDGELAELRQSGGEISSRVHQLGADLQRQEQSLAERSAANEERIAVVRGEARSWLADSEQRWDARLASENARVDAELNRLDGGIGALEGLFRTQEQILAEQRARLDQFDITCELLDTATRGNKSRIEAVREQVERQHAIVEARIDGLSALQREHYAEFKSLQGLVGVLRSETERLDAEICRLAGALEEHQEDTRDRFKWTHLAIAGLFVLTVMGFALVKWVPAFAPASTTSALAQNEARIGEVGSQVAALSERQAALQDTVAAQQTSIDQVSGKVSGLEKSLGDLRAAVRKLRLQNAGAGVLHDSQWLLRQNPKAYTVQLVSSPSQADMARFINRNIEQLALDSLAFSVTERDQGESYNLFFGVFNTVGEARAAIAALPAELRANRPWVRRLQSVQDSLR